MARLSKKEWAELQEWKKTWVCTFTAEIKRETEKAVLIAVKVECSGRFTKTASVWMPKSFIQAQETIDGGVKISLKAGVWYHDKVMDNIYNDLGCNLGNLSIATIES